MVGVIIPMGKTRLSLLGDDLENVATSEMSSSGSEYVEQLRISLYYKEDKWKRTS